MEAARVMLFEHDLLTRQIYTDGSGHYSSTDVEAGPVPRSRRHARGANRRKNDLHLAWTEHCVRYFSVRSGPNFRKSDGRR